MNLANYSNLPSILPIFTISITLPLFYNYLLSINPRKASWSAISYALTYTVVPYGLFVIAIISPIAIAIGGIYCCIRLHITAMYVATSFAALP